MMLAGLLGSVPACAETWPERTVKIIVPLPVGGGTDLAARLLAERLAERWHQPAVVENRPGVDGLVGVSAFVNAHDDHTLLFSFAGPLSINPLIYDRLPYDPVRDLVPIASAIDNFFCVAVSTTLGIDSMPELIAYARKNPGKLNWAATAGLPQYIFAALQKSERIELAHVPYRDFGPALQDLAQGRVHVVATTPSILLAQVQAKRVKLLMITNRERTAIAPEVPTAREAGYPDLEFEGVVGFYGWRDMPPALRRRIAADVEAAASEATLVRRLTELGIAVRPGGPQALAAAVEAQHAKVRELIPDAPGRSTGSKP
jgi:tripartite-type tricarboxylate transporter receptor subunit TctC